MENHLRDDKQFEDLHRKRIFHGQLYGSAQRGMEYWIDESWENYKNHFKALYHDSLSFNTLMEEMRGLRREKGESLGLFFSRIFDLCKDMELRTTNQYSTDSKEQVIRSEAIKAFATAMPESFQNRLGEMRDTGKTLGKIMAECTSWAVEHPSEGLTAEAIRKEEEEVRKKDVLETSTEVTSAETNTVGWKKQSKRNNKHWKKGDYSTDVNNNKAQAQIEEEIRCFACGGLYHLARNCVVQRRQTYDWYGGRRGTGGTNETYWTKTENQTVCQNCGSIGHTAPFCWTRNNTRNDNSGTGNTSSERSKRIQNRREEESYTRRRVNKVGAVVDKHDLDEEEEQHSGNEDQGVFTK